MRKFMFGPALLLPALALTAPADPVAETLPRGWDAATAPTSVAATLAADFEGPAALALHSAWRGARAGAISQEGNRAVFVPAQPLLAGEPLEATLTASNAAHAWRFSAPALGGSASFITNSLSLRLSVPGARFRALALADLRGDGALELAAPGWNSNSVFTASAGSLTTSLLARAIQDITAADFNNDGRPDLLLGCATQAFAVALNPGNGFSNSPAVQAIAGVTGTLRVAVADLDRDGRPDAAALAETSGHLTPLLNTGGGALAAGVPVPCGFTLYALDLGDLDGDGAPDAVAVGSAGRIAILLNGGDGSFGNPTLHSVGEQSLYACRIGDFNRDGRADIAVAGAEGVIHIGYGSPSGFVFEAVSHGLTSATLYGLTLGDFDANGWQDLAVAGGDTVLVLPGGPSGFLFTIPPLVLPGEILRDIECGDLNGDGSLDLAVCGFTSGRAWILWNAPAALPLVRSAGGLPIADNAPPSPAAGTDFGSVPVFNSSTGRFQLVNGGEGLLLVTGYALTGESTAFLQVVGMPSQVEPGATSGFAVVLSPLSTGTVSGTLVISNNSPATVTNAVPVYRLNLAGLGIRRTPDSLAIEATNHVYDGTAKSAVASVSPTSLAAAVTLTYEGSPLPPVTAGVYTVVATVDDPAYAGSATATLSLAKRPLAVLCADASRTYGDPNPSFPLALTNFADGEGETNLTTLPAAASAASNASPVGLYPIVASGGEAANYGFVYSNATLSVTQATLTVRPENRMRQFGDPNPPFPLLYDGFRNGDGTNAFSSQPFAVSLADTASPPGEYPITVSGGTALNYAFLHTPGTLTVYATLASITITNLVQVYDGSPKSVEVLTDPPGIVSYTVAYNGLEQEPVTAGVYRVLVTITATNYSGTNSATFTILKANQSLTAFLPSSGAYPADRLLGLSASGSASGIPPVFEVVAGPGLLVSSNELRFLGTGAVHVAAWQPGDANWNPSAPLTNTYSAVETNTIHYAARAGQTPFWPYADWSTAASNIQEAVDLAAPGETVLVGPGLYDEGERPAAGSLLPNRLVLEKPVAVRSSHGPEVTFIVGRAGTGPDAPLGPDALRCAYISYGSLEGFTLSNGYTHAGGPDSDTRGGGALMTWDSGMTNCVIAHCAAVRGGGVSGGQASRIVLHDNLALMEGGGAHAALLLSSLVRNNESLYGGGAFNARLNNCTVVDNRASFGGGLFECGMANGIVWHNEGGDLFGSSAWFVNAGNGVSQGVNGCQTNPPAFVNRMARDYRLAYGSTCINAGLDMYLDWDGPIPHDLDGTARVKLGTVDLGAYEFNGTPGAPLLTSASNVLARQSALSWTLQDDKAAVTRFRMEIDITATPGLDRADLIPAPALSTIVTGLAPDSVYAIRLRSENDYDASDWSGWQSFTTLTEAAFSAPASLLFHATYGAGPVLTQNVVLANAGAVPGVWTGSVAYAGASGWLTATPSSGTVPAFGAADLAFTVDPASLHAGTYSAWHTVASTHATNTPLVQAVTVIVTRATDTITFGATNQVYNGSPRPVTASTISGSPVALTYNGSSTPPVAAGVYAVTGVVDAADWTAVQSAWLTVEKAPQAIGPFLPASSDIPATNLVCLSAAGGGSGLPVTFTILSGPAVLDVGNRLQFTGYGAVVVEAAQAGDANWQPAPPLTNVYTIMPVAALEHFAAQDGQSPSWPFASWASAASNVQDAVDAAWDGDTVTVGDGHYREGGRPAPGQSQLNRVTVIRSITLRSANGPEAAFIHGSTSTPARALYAGTNAVIRGFTLTDGSAAAAGDRIRASSGGGAFLEGGALLSHSIVRDNIASNYGGGVCLLSGGLDNVLVHGNSASNYGGGLALLGDGTATHCTLAGNHATFGGGLYLPATGKVRNSIIRDNTGAFGLQQNIIAMGDGIAYTCSSFELTDGLNGNIVTNPSFASGGYRLSAGSPCIGIGDDSQVLSETDLAGNPRRVGTTDLGAYEWLAAPAAPAGLAITNRTGVSALLLWEPGDFMPATGFEIEVEQLPDSTTVLAESLPGVETSLLVTALSEGTDYRFRVRAANGEGPGDWSGWFAFTTLGAIRSVTPDACAVTGGVSVLVEGPGLGDGADIAAVLLCGLETVIEEQGRDWVRVTAPASPSPRIGDVRVVSPTGGELVLSNAFTYLPVPLKTIAINCGGKAIGSFDKDRGFLTGVPFRTTSPIETIRAWPMAVYQSARFGAKVKYSFPELPNGVYKVRLGFAELKTDLPGARRFNVKIEGQTVLSRLDVRALTGARFRAYRPLFTVTVRDGNGLQIQAAGIDGAEAFINAFLIAPAPPAGMVAAPGGVLGGNDPDFGAYSLTNRSAFYMDATEITHRQWEDVRAWALTNGYPDLPEGGGKGSDHPVQTVSWHDCAKWCNARSEKSGLKPAYYTGADHTEVYRTGIADLAAACVDPWGGYRLPTEQEWEFAARRDPAQSRFPFGATIGHAAANYNSIGGEAYDVSLTAGFHPLWNDGTEPYTSPAGAFAATGNGLHDLAGNVAEWCWNREPGGTGERATRGGSWLSEAPWCRIGERLPCDPGLRIDCVGFRTVMTRP